MMFAQTRMDAPKNGASSRDAHISVDMVAAPAMNTSGLRKSASTSAAAYRPAPRSRRTWRTNTGFVCM